MVQELKSHFEMQSLGVVEIKQSILKSASKKDTKHLDLWSV